MEIFFITWKSWKWTIRKTEHWRIDAFKLVVLEKTLKSPLDSKEIRAVHPKGNQSWIFVARTDAEAETPILGHLMWRTNSLEKTLMLGGTGGRREGDDRVWDGWMASLTRRTWVWVNSGSWWWTGKPDVLRFMGSQRVRHDWATELSWTDLTFIAHDIYCAFLSSFEEHRGRVCLCVCVCAHVHKVMIKVRQ